MQRCWLPTLYAEIEALLLQELLLQLLLALDASPGTSTPRYAGGTRVERSARRCKRGTCRFGRRA
jgi:hypothetical protein